MTRSFVEIKAKLLLERVVPGDLAVAVYLPEHGLDGGLLIERLDHLPLGVRDDQVHQVGVLPGHLESAVTLPSIMMRRPESAGSISAIRPTSVTMPVNIRSRSLAQRRCAGRVRAV